MTAKGLATLMVTALGMACGGTGRNPVTPALNNQPPAILRIELVGHTAAGFDAQVPIRAEAQDPDGDAVTCRWAAATGRVLVDSANSCVGVYFAPGSGASDRVDVTPTDSRGASGDAGTIMVPLASESIAIGGASPSPDPDPTPRPRPSPTQRPDPTPAPAPAPTPTPQPNKAPSVGIAGAGSCHPACSKTLTANASDPDGDPVTHAWSGACAGTGNSATVNVTALQAYTCTVTVSDGRGGSASTSASVTGTNQTPSISHEGLTTLPGASGQHWIGFGVSDDDPAQTGRCSSLYLSAYVGNVVSCALDSDRGGLVINITGYGSAALSWTFTDRWGASQTATMNVRAQ